MVCGQTAFKFQTLQLFTGIRTGLYKPPPATLVYAFFGMYLIISLALRGAYL